MSNTYRRLQAKKNPSNTVINNLPTPVTVVVTMDKDKHIITYSRPNGEYLYISTNKHLVKKEMDKTCKGRGASCSEFSSFIYDLMTTDNEYRNVKMFMEELNIKDGNFYFFCTCPGNFKLEGGSVNTLTNVY